MAEAADSFRLCFEGVLMSGIVAGTLSFSSSLLAMNSSLSASFSRSFCMMSDCRAVSFDRMDSAMGPNGLTTGLLGLLPDAVLFDLDCREGMGTASLAAAPAAEALEDAAVVAVGVGVLVPSPSSLCTALAFIRLPNRAEAAAVVAADPFANAEAEDEPHALALAPAPAVAETSLAVPLRSLTSLILRSRGESMSSSAGSPPTRDAMIAPMSRTGRLSVLGDDAEGAERSVRFDVSRVRSSLSGAASRSFVGLMATERNEAFESEEGDPGALSAGVVSISLLDLASMVGVVVVGRAMVVERRWRGGVMVRCCQGGRLTSLTADIGRRGAIVRSV